MLFAKTLLLALAGAGAALALNLPLPWLLGPMLLLTALSMAGMRLRFAEQLRNPLFALIGFYLGSSVVEQSALFRPEWLYTAALMLAFTALATGLCAWYFMRAAGYAREHALLAALPGALAYIVAHVVERNLPATKIIVAQSVRVLLVVALAPFLYRHFVGGEPQEINRFAWQPFARGWLIDLALITVVSAPVIWLLNKLRVVNPWFLGGMLASLLCYAGGATTHALPAWLLQVLLIFIGAMIGCRFAGTRIGELLIHGGHSIVAAMLLLALTALTAWGGARILGLDPVAMFLAFAPGGVHEMALIAFAYSIEPVFVTFHHVLRIFFISWLIPLTGRIKHRRNNRAGE